MTGSLAQQLARAVVRGLLPAEHVIATIALNAASCDDPDRTIRCDEHLVGLCIDKLEAECDRTRGAIHNVVLPMLRRAVKPPRNAIRAKAHEANGDSGFPLTEDDVEDELLELLRRLAAKAAAQQRGGQPWRPRRYHV